MTMPRKIWIMWLLCGLLVSCQERRPYNAEGKPWPLPGIIEVENYDEGPWYNRGYADTTRGSEASKREFYRDSDVDFGVDPLVNVVDVGWVEPGEWLEYTAEVKQKGTYTIRFRMATTMDGRYLRLRWNGVDLAGQVSLPNTGCWGSDHRGNHCFQEAEVKGIALPQGVGRLRLEAGTGGYTIDKISFALDQGAATK